MVICSKMVSTRQLLDVHLLHCRMLCFKVKNAPCLELWYLLITDHVTAFADAQKLAKNMCIYIYISIDVGKNSRKKWALKLPWSHGYGWTLSHGQCKNAKSSCSPSHGERDRKRVFVRCLAKERNNNEADTGIYHIYAFNLFQPKVIPLPRGSMYGIFTYNFQ